MKSGLKITLIVIGILLVVGIFYYMLFSSLIQEAPPISRDSFLELNIYGEVAERASPDPFTKIFSGEPPSMAGLLQCIRKAKVDPKIIGIVLRPMGSEIGWAKIEELKDALVDFKESEKPIYAYLEIGANREYYLSLVSDMIFGSPNGAVLINGFLARGYYFKRSLDKLGIEADFVAHGKYKSAPNIFTNENMSPSEEEVINSLLDDYYPRYIQSISRARDLSLEEVTTCIDRGFYNLKAAYEKNLIDTLMYYNEFKDYLKSINDNKSRFVSYSRYKKIPFSELGIKASKRIALIYGLGTIVSGIGEDMSEEGVMTSEGMANTIRKVASNKRIKAIVMRINSPGGSGIASDIIWREVVKAKEEKPVIVTMSDVAASGGYYIAMAADSIVAQPSSLVGSIGVYAGKFSFAKLYEKLGISKQEIPRGANSNIFSELNKFDTKQRKLIKDGIMQFYNEFVSKAAEGRNATFEEIDKIAQGRVWTGSQALENGLIDKLGGLNEAIQIAKKMAGIPIDDHVLLEVYPRQKSFIDRLISRGLEAKHFISINDFPFYLKTYLNGFLYLHENEPLLLIPYYIEIR